MNTDEIEICDAEARAIKEAEYIAASESIRLVQELSLRLDLSEPSSKVGSRIQSSHEIYIEDENKDDMRVENIKNNKVICEPIIMKDGDLNEVEHGSCDNLMSQESKLILNEFENDLDSSMMEQDENGSKNESECENIDNVTIEESNINKSDVIDENCNVINEDTTSIYENNEELVIKNNCIERIGTIRDYAKNGCDHIADFRKLLINNIKTNIVETNKALKNSSIDYLNAFHSKLILMAGLHSPSECSICKEFKHQDVPLLN